MSAVHTLKVKGSRQKVWTVQTKMNPRKNRGFMVSDYSSLFDDSRFTIHDLRHLPTHRIRQTIINPRLEVFYNFMDLLITLPGLAIAVANHSVCAGDDI
jgi:hypothetical protein